MNNNINNKKKRLLALLTITLLFAPKVNAKSYTEGYIGGMFGRAHITKLSVKNIYKQGGLKANLSCLPSQSVSSSVIGGFKLGLWGENHYSEHFGLYCDLSFNKLDYCHNFCHEKICYKQQENTETCSQNCVQNCCNKTCTQNCNCNCACDCDNLVTGSGYTDINFSGQGHDTNLAFMVAFRTCHFKTKEIPYGKLQPYLAIGPSILFANQCAKIIIGPHEINDSNFALILKNSYTIEPQKKASKACACLAIDTGLKQILTSSFALDYAFKYRFAPCKLSFCPCNPNTCTTNSSTTTEQNNFTNDKLAFTNRYNLFSFTFGLVYEF